MRKSWSVLLAVTFVVKMCAAASAASVGGTMASSQGQPLTGVQVIVKDASGHVIGQGAPGSGGGYDIQGLQPGNYNFTLDPGSSGYQLRSARSSSVGSGALGRRGSRTGGWHCDRSRSWTGERLRSRQSQDAAVNRRMSSAAGANAIDRSVGRYSSRSL